MSTDVKDVRAAFDKLDRTVRRKLNSVGGYPTKEEFQKREDLRQELRKLTVKPLEARKDLLLIEKAIYEQEKRRGAKETPSRTDATGESDGAESI